MLKKLAKCVGEYKSHAIKTPIYVAFECVFDVIIPFLMAFLIDEGINKGDSGVIIKIGIILILCSILAMFCGVMSGRHAARASSGFARNLRSRISEKINKLPLKYFDSHEAGDVLSRVTNDVDTIAQNLNNSLATIVTAGTLWLGCIFMMFITNWILALTAIFSCIIGLSCMFFILGKSQKYFMKRQEELGNINGYIEEMYSGHNVVKVYNAKKKL